MTVETRRSWYRINQTGHGAMSRHAPSWFPGSCSITFTHADQSLLLPTKSRPGSKRTFSELCKDITPPCDLNPFLFGGDLQTIWTMLDDNKPCVSYKRRVFAADDPTFPGHFAVDFVVPAPPLSRKSERIHPRLRHDPSGVGHVNLPVRTTYFTNKEFENIGSNDSKPLLISLPGLSGGSNESYIQHVLAVLTEKSLLEKMHLDQGAGVSGGDWEALVINHRGCAGSRITSPRLYNARSTWDIRQIVKWAKETFPNRPLFAVGYSLGANILANYVAEEGEDCQLSAAVLICNPFDLDSCHKSLKRSFMGRQYSKAMGASMRGLVEMHKTQMSRNKALDLERVLVGKFLYEFDRDVQCATWGYPTEGTYYRDASSSDGMLAVRIPLFALHAKNDPIVADEGVPYQEIAQNPYTVLCTTSAGGHLGWFELGGGRWYVRPIVNFLHAMLDLDLNGLKQVLKGVNDTAIEQSTPFAFDPVRKKARLSEDIA